MSDTPDAASPGNDPMDIAALFDLSVPEPASSDGGAGKQETDQQQDGTGKQPSSPGPAPDAAAEPLAQTTAQTPAQPSPDELAQLRGQIAAYENVIKNQPQPQAQPQPNQPAAPSLPSFPVQIPDDIIQALAADDPSLRRRAYEHLGSNLGARAVFQAQQYVNEQLAQVARAIPQVITSMISQHQQMTTWHDQFYKTYPQLGASPQLKQFVGNTAAELARNGQIQTLDHRAMELVAVAVRDRLVGNRQPAAMPQRPAAPVANRPAVATTNARQMSDTNPVDPNSPEAIMAVLFGG